MTDQATREAAADLLDWARDVLAERGWCQNALEDDAGQLCLEGAVERAAAVAGVHLEVGGVAIAAVRVEVDGPAWMFNDLPTTTQSDVDLALKRAAHSLREAS